MDAQVTSEKELRQLQRENNSRLLQKLDSQNKQLSSMLSSLRSEREEGNLFMQQAESQLKSTVSRMESTISRITSRTKRSKTAKLLDLKIAAYWDERHPPKRLAPRKLRPKISRRRFAVEVFA